MQKIKTEIQKSSLIVGIKPITNQHVHSETVKILNEGKYNKQTEAHKIRAAATKNAVHRFFKDELKMD